MTSELREIQSLGFESVCVIDVERTSSGDPVEYLPQDRYANRSGHALNPNGVGPFCKMELPALNRSPGVYAIVIGESVVYIGECQNFAERYGPRGYGVIHPRNCFVGGQSTNFKINARVLTAIKAELSPILYFVAETEAPRKVVERDLIALLLPKWNG